MDPLVQLTERGAPDTQAAAVSALAHLAAHKDVAPQLGRMRAAALAVMLLRGAPQPTTRERAARLLANLAHANPDNQLAVAQSGATAASLCGT